MCCCSQGDDVIFSGLVNEALTGDRDLSSSITVRDIFREVSSSSSVKLYFDLHIQIQLPVRRRHLLEVSTVRSELEKCRKAFAVLSSAYPEVHVTLRFTSLEEEREIELLNAMRVGRK